MAHSEKFRFQYGAHFSSLKMSRTVTLSVIFSCLGLIGCQEARDHYTAAVVEYAQTPQKNDTAATILNRNVDNYISLLEKTKKSNPNLDIIVYPEGTLTSSISSSDIINTLLNITTQVPEPSKKVVPCDATAGDAYPEFFKKLSCAAKQHETYVVVNLKEKINCTADLAEQGVVNGSCARHGYNLYNTNVAFDRKGTVIARYRKYNLFGEKYLNTTVKPEKVSFETDFNVTFGLFTCFDILFKHPALDLIKGGVKNIVFPTYWFSELPFLTALQAQQSFVQEHKVNFLSAGGNYIEKGSGGTGIFQANGPLVYDYVIEGTTKVFVANVSKTITAGDENEPYDVADNDKMALEMDKFVLIRDNIEVYTHKNLNTTISGSVEDELCHKGTNESFCCHFKVEVSVDNSNPSKLPHYYRYQMVAFTGVRSFTGMYNGGVEHCGIIACLNDTLKSCGLRFPDHSKIYWPVTFNSINITADYHNDPDRFQTPSSLLSSIRPIYPNDTEWTSVTTGNVTRRTYLLVKPQNRLLTFAIHGRDVARDSEPGKGGAGPTTTTTGAALLLLLTITKFI